MTVNKRPTALLSVALPYAPALPCGPALWPRCGGAVVYMGKAQPPARP